MSLVEEVVSQNLEENLETENQIKLVDDVENKAAEVSSQDDVYEYLNREGFTSEKFKIEIRGLPKFYGISEFKKLLNEKLSLDCAKLKTIRPGNPWAFVCFRSEEDRSKAISVINGYKWKGKSLTAHEAKPAPDPLVKKRKQQASEDTSSPKKAKDDISQEEKLKNTTTPYWNITYEEQLTKKQNEAKDILKQYCNQLSKWAQPPLRKWIGEQRKKHNGLICELMEIKRSPVTEGYRNKCEFTVGIDCETNLPTVGFRLTSYDAGSTAVGPVHHLNHIPERMKLAVEAFQKFVRNSNFKVFSPEDHSGHFKQLTARVSTFTNELMLIVGIHSQNLSRNRIEDFKEELKEFFTLGEGKNINVNSLYLQCITKRAPGEGTPVPEHIMGETHITDQINGLKYRISAEAFFQVNTPCAEVLYNQAIEISKPTSDTTLLDVCCGSGTIGLSFAKHCDKVIGVEIMAQAVEDAKNNAIANEIANAEFHTGPAEDLLGSLLWATKGQKDLLAVVDPPRAGLHTRAVTQLRRFPNLNRLVYVACGPRSAMKNWVDLARPASKTMHGAPFLPVRAVAVDMFPQTKHCEFVLYFERASVPKDAAEVNDKTPDVKSEMEVDAAVKETVDKDVGKTDDTVQVDIDVKKSGDEAEAKDKPEVDSQEEVEVKSQVEEEVAKA